MEHFTAVYFLSLFNDHTVVANRLKSLTVVVNWGEDVVEGGDGQMG